MPNIPCPNVIPAPCPCFDSDPVANFSAEKPDQDVFIGIVFFDGTQDLSLNQLFEQLSCLGICESTISQDAANDCARLLAQLCAQQTWRNQTGFTGGRPGTRAPLFFNTAQTCTIQCPDGSTFDWSLRAGARAVP